MNMQKYFSSCLIATISIHRICLAAAVPTACPNASATAFFISLIGTSSCIFNKITTIVDLFDSPRRRDHDRLLEYPFVLLLVIPTGPSYCSYHPNNKILNASHNNSISSSPIATIFDCRIRLTAAVPIVSANLLASSFFHHARSKQENNRYSTIYARALQIFIARVGEDSAGGYGFCQY